MAFTSYNAPLTGMVAGEFKLISTNRPHDVALARTRANFDAGTKFADDAAVAAVIKAANPGIYAFSGSPINGNTGTIKHRGGGHTDGGDGSIFDFDPATLTWTVSVKSCRYESTAPTVTCGITAIAAGTPPRLTVDADVAVTGDQGVITGTTDADGTYQLVRISATQVDLYNIDGTYSAKYTAFSGGGLTDSTGTLTITWNPQTVVSDTYYGHTNADGQQVPPCPHTYHWKWIGGNKYLLSGSAVLDTVGDGQQRRVWILDDDASPKVYRSYHDHESSGTNPDTARGAPWGTAGLYAYNDNDGYVYGFNNQVKNFQYRTYKWPPDFQQVTSIEFDGSLEADANGDAVVIPDPADAADRMLFAMQTNSSGLNDFIVCSDIQGTPVMSGHAFVDGDMFNTDMVGHDTIGYCWDSTNGEIVYWGGGATLGAITVDADLDAWTTAEVTPATPTGDTPTSTGTTHQCSICKIPDHDAYLLTQGGNVYLYARSTIVGAASTIRNYITTLGVS